jgi:proteasome lid subunit RPN8/RPN11
MKNFVMSEALLGEILTLAQAGYPNEVCGIIAGRDGAAEKIYPITNSDPSPVSYHMEPAEQFRVMKEIRQEGLKMIGIYHSHPQSAPFPSAKDISLAFYDDVIYMIAGMSDRYSPDVRCYEIREGRISDVAFVISDSI